MSDKRTLEVAYDYTPRMVIGETVIEFEKAYKLTLSDGQILIGKFTVKQGCEGYYDINFINDFYKIDLPSNYCEKDLDDHIVAIERID